MKKILWILVIVILFFSDILAATDTKTISDDYDYYISKNSIKLGLTYDLPNAFIEMNNHFQNFNEDDLQLLENIALKDFNELEIPKTEKEMKSKCLNILTVLAAVGKNKSYDKIEEIILKNYQQMDASILKIFLHILEEQILNKNMNVHLSPFYDDYSLKLHKLHLKLLKDEQVDFITRIRLFGISSNFFKNVTIQEIEEINNLYTKKPDIFLKQSEKHPDIEKRNKDVSSFYYSKLSDFLIKKIKQYRDFIK